MIFRMRAKASNGLDTNVLLFDIYEDLGGDEKEQDYEFRVRTASAPLWSTV